MAYSNDFTSSSVASDRATGFTINSFVFLDLETSHLLPTDRPTIIEICMIAINREGLLCSEFRKSVTCARKEGFTFDLSKVSLPRIVDKLTMCLDPRKYTSSDSVRFTKLDKQNLDKNKKLPFDKDALSIINIFLRRQEAPICLVAHNGNRFDFPILRSEVLRLTTQDLSDDLYCVDSLSGFKSEFATERGHCERTRREIKKGSTGMHAEHPEPDLPLKRKFPACDNFRGMASSQKRGSGVFAQDVQRGRDSLRCLATVTSTYMPSGNDVSSYSHSLSSESYDPSENKRSKRLSPVSSKLSQNVKFHSLSPSKNSYSLSSSENAYRFSSSDSCCLSVSSSNPSPSARSSRISPSSSNLTSSVSSYSLSPSASSFTLSSRESTYPSPSFRDTTFQGSIGTISPKSSSDENFILSLLSQHNPPSSQFIDPSEDSIPRLPRCHSPPASATSQSSYISPSPAPLRKSQSEPYNEGRRKRQRVSYSLVNIFKRIFGREPPCSHTAEGDVVSLIKVLLPRMSEFVSWADMHATPFKNCKQYYSPECQT